jgi:hypothetical protein
MSQNLNQENQIHSKIDEKALLHLRNSNSLDQHFLKTLKLIHSQINKYTNENKAVLVGKLLIENACRMNNLVDTEKSITTIYGAQKTMKEYILDNFLMILIKIGE